MDRLPRSGNSSKPAAQDGRLRTTSFDHKVEERLRTTSFADQRNDSTQQSSNLRLGSELYLEHVVAPLAVSVYTLLYPIILMRYL